MAPLLIVVNILLVIVALILIVAVLMQQGNTANLGAISGGAETFFGKNKAKSYEGKLALITKVCAGLFIVLAITATALSARLNATASNAPASVTPTEDVAEIESEETDAMPEVEAADALEEDVADDGEAEATPIPEE